MNVERGHVGTRYVVLISSVAALGGLLFGYDTAVISGAIGFVQERFELDTDQTSWAAACALVGCMIGAALAGQLADRLGRKKVLLFSAILFTVSAWGSAVAGNLNQLVWARILGGLGIGMASMTSPLYIAEVSPPSIRGRLVSLNQFAIVFGMLAVYFVNAWVALWGDDTWNIATGWRWMFGSEVIPAVLFLVLLFRVPESPRWLAKQGRDAEARTILGKVGGAEHAAAEMEEIRSALLEEEGTVRQLFSPGIRKALLVGIGLAILQQITGINIVLYFAPEIFKKTGGLSAQAISDTVFVGIVNLIFTVVAVWVVDKIGRKPLLMIASTGMGISLFLLGRAFIQEQFGGVWILLFVLLYVASFAVAMGPVVWVVMSEIFPTKIRGRAMSLATVCLWIACFLVSRYFLLLLERLGGYAFFIYAGMCLVSFIFVGLVVPETKGQSLEEIERSWLAGHKGTDR
ncbi:MAG: sugar porter family MFS transporter [Phycisphaerales bacterium]|nr:sugar porter family MFS transporter [Phycisphaerales bacterium]